MSMVVTLLPAVFSVLSMAAGWHYLFYSRAAARLATVEQTGANRQRVWLRRAGGSTMILLGICFFAGSYSIDPKRSAGAYLLIWTTVLLLLLVIVILALVDLRLTWRLRRARRTKDLL